MNKQVLNFGILGCGMIADFHARAIRAIENAQLLGVADNNIASAERFSQKYGVAFYQSFEEMLADSRIDAVCICTPSGFHADNAIAALKAGKHVVVEKPIAISAADAEKVAAAAKESGRILTVVSQLRFAADVQRVKQLVEQNAFGKIVFCDLNMKYWRSPEYYAGSVWKGTKRFDGGGALMNQGIHGVDLILYIMGNAKITAAKTKTAFHNIEVEDTAVAMLEFENGAVGVIEASTCAYNGFERKIEILGTNGCAVLKENQLEKLIVNGQTVIDGSAQEVAGTASDPAAMDILGHKTQIRNFIGAILGEEALLIDANEGSRAVALIEEIYHA